MRNDPNVEAVVYHLTNDYDINDGYVGVTRNLEYRLKRHSKTKTWKYDRVLFRGPEPECYVLENKLRPEPYMGWNVAIGGQGGYSSYTEERNKRISMANKGVKKSAEHIEKMRKTLSDGRRKTSGNGRAKSWVLTNPDGDDILINGELQKVCKDLGILWATLWYNKGEVIGEVSPKFREKYPGHRQLRENTIGWKLGEKK